MNKYKLFFLLFSLSCIKVNFASCYIYTGPSIMNPFASPIYTIMDSSGAGSVTACGADQSGNPQTGTQYSLTLSVQNFIDNFIIQGAGTGVSATDTYSFKFNVSDLSASTPSVSVSSPTSSAGLVPVSNVSMGWSKNYTQKIKDASGAPHTYTYNVSLSSSFGVKTLSIAQCDEVAQQLIGSNTNNLWMYVSSTWSTSGLNPVYANFWGNMCKLAMYIGVAIP